MHLTRQTDFALRTMIYLAALPPGERVQIRTVCERFEIAPSHLSKIVNKLANSGYIDSLRGRGGGIRLGREAADINVGALVQLMEPSLTPINCESPRCVLLPGCRFRIVLGKASKAFIDTIAGYTLEDLVDGEREALRLV